MNAKDLNVVLAGIGIVFICMVLITLALYFFPLIFGGKKNGKKETKKAEPAETIKPAMTEIIVKSEPEKDDKELIAVITAAISAYLGSESNIKFKVKSFKRIGDGSAWSKTSRLENLSE